MSLFQIMMYVRPNRDQKNLGGRKEGAAFRAQMHVEESGMRGKKGGGVFVFAAIALFILLPDPGHADTTLETDTEALAQMYFALGGPSWIRRGGKHHALPFHCPDFTKTIRHTILMYRSLVCVLGPLDHGEGEGSSSRLMMGLPD